MAWSHLNAQTTNWIGPLNNTGDWFTATNWSNGVPNLTSTVTIPSFVYPVIDGLPAQAASMTIGGSSQVNFMAGGTLEVSDSLTNAGAIVENDDSILAALVTIDSGGTVLNKGSIGGGEVALLFSEGGTLNNTGRITTDLNTPNSAFANGAVEVEGGAGNIVNAGSIRGNNGVSLLNNGTITNTGIIWAYGVNDNGFNSNSGSGIFLAGGGTITNEAGATIQGTGTFSWGIHTVSAVPVKIDNFGTISGNVDGINVNSDSQITNEAGGLITSSMESAIAVSNGSNSVITNSGTISSTATDGSPAIALFYGGTINNNASGVITGNDGNAITTGFQGDTGPTTLYNYGTINGNVTLANQPNTAILYTGGTINGSLNLGSSAATQLILDGSGQEALSQAVTGFIANSGSLIKQGSGDWIIDEYLRAPVSTAVNSGILTINQTLDTGALAVAAGATVNGTGNTNIDAGGTLTNSGTILTTAGGEAVFLNAGASLTNNAGASIQSTPVNGCGIFGSSAGPVEITNAGIIGGYTGIVLNGGGSITNSGMISGVGNGVSLAAGGSITNAGTISSNGSGIYLQSGGSITNENGATITSNGYGDVFVWGGTLNLTNAGTISGQSGIALANGASGSVSNDSGGIITGTNGVAIDTTGSTGAFTLSNAGTINGSVNLGNGTNAVTLVTGGNINGSLNLGSNSGSTLVLDGSGQQALSQAVSGSISNSGSLTKQGAGT